MSFSTMAAARQKLMNDRATLLTSTTFTRVCCRAGSITTSNSERAVEIMLTLAPDGGRARAAPGPQADGNNGLRLALDPTLRMVCAGAPRWVRWWLVLTAPTRLADGLGGEGLPRLLPIRPCQLRRSYDPVETDVAGHMPALGSP